MTVPKVVPVEADRSDPDNTTSSNNPGSRLRRLTSHYAVLESKTDLAASLDYNQLESSPLVSQTITCVSGSTEGEKTTSLLGSWLTLILYSVRVEDDSSVTMAITISGVLICFRSTGESQESIILQSHMYLQDTDCVG